MKADLWRQGRREGMGWEGGEREFRAGLEEGEQKG